MTMFLFHVLLVLLGSSYSLNNYAVKPVKSFLKSTWDLFGRVPNDDFLFRTSNLISPQLLTRTFTETVNKL
jgi:hypothetical protein